MSDQKNLKNFISRAVLAALVGAAVAFFVTVFLPKFYRVTGKIVIVPSSSSLTAGQNLYLEAQNTAEFINSPSFEKNVLGDEAQNFEGAKGVENSSVVSVNYLSSAQDIQKTEDILVKFPAKAAGYARDLYSGQPFKYLLLSDPEVSRKPVKPDLYKNIVLGLLAGLAAFLLYWLMIEDFLFQKSETEELPIEPKGQSIEDFRPDMKEKTPEKEKKIEKKKSDEKKSEMSEKAYVQPIPFDSAPANLPVMPARPTGGEEPAAPTSEFQEPSDEEVKDRLNKLMRGEL